LLAELNCKNSTGVLHCNYLQGLCRASRCGSRTGKRACATKNDGKTTAEIRVQDMDFFKKIGAGG
jgi:hypothetical protein